MPETAPAHLAGLPTCDVPPCTRVAIHLYADLREAEPKASGRMIATPDGQYVPELVRQWVVRSRHARCDLHQAPARRHYLDGHIETDDGLSHHRTDGDALDQSGTGPAT